MKSLIFTLTLIFLVSLAAAISIQVLYGKDYEDPTSSEHLEIEPVNYISINSLAMDVNVILHDGDKILIDYVNETPIDVEFDENKLNINEKESVVISFLSIKQFDYKITVSLPSRFYREIKVKNKIGNTLISGISSDTVLCDSVTGNISIYGINSLLKVSSDSGKIECSFDDLIHDASITSTKGNVKAILPPATPVSLEYKTTTGRFLSDFFVEDYDIEGSFKVSSGIEPNTLKVITKMGDLHLLKK